MNERGPVGGAGELTALSYKSLAESWLNEHKRSWSAHDLFTLVRLLESRAAKAPQGAAVLQEHQDKAIRILRPYISGAEFGEVVALVAQAIADAREAAAPKPAPPQTHTDDCMTFKGGPCNCFEPAPACIGYPDCDGDLEGEQHSKKCKTSAASHGETEGDAGRQPEVCQSPSVDCKPDAGLDAVERSFSPHVAAPTPAPGAERPADGYGEVLSIIDRWQRFHLKPDQFVAALREALAAAPPAPRPHGLVNELEREIIRLNKDVADWIHKFHVYRGAWLREIGGYIRRKSHEIDGFVLRTQDALKEAEERGRHASAERVREIECKAILALMGNEPYLAAGRVVEGGEWEWKVVADKVSITTMLTSTGEKS